MMQIWGEVKEVFAFQENRVLKNTDCPDVNVVAMKLRAVLLFNNHHVGV